MFYCVQQPLFMAEKIFYGNFDCFVKSWIGYHSIISYKSMNKENWCKKGWLYKGDVKKTVTNTELTNFVNGGYHWVI